MADLMLGISLLATAAAALAATLLCIGAANAGLSPFLGTAKIAYDTAQNGKYKNNDNCVFHT